MILSCSGDLLGTLVHMNGGGLDVRLDRIQQFVVLVHDLGDVLKDLIHVDDVGLDLLDRLFALSQQVQIDLFLNLQIDLVLLLTFWTLQIDQVGIVRRQCASVHRVRSGPDYALFLFLRGGSLDNLEVLQRLQELTRQLLL